MLLKQYRLNLEFTFDITEITEFQFRSRLKRYKNYEELINEPGVREHTEHQRRLLQGLLDNPEVLDRYIRYRIASLFEANGVELIKEALGNENEETVAEKELLRPVIDSLPEEDARFFREVIDEGIYYENTEEFSDCSQLKLVKADIIEVK